MKFYNIFIIFFCLLSNNIWGQVKFQLDILPDGETYQVSLLPETTWESPQNMTATGQVTIKTPENQFDVVDFTNLQTGVVWEMNSRTNQPIEEPKFDYISFGLASQGTKQINYTNGQLIPLFTFKNAQGCQGAIRLMDNANDPFFGKNSKKVNVGNQLTVLAAGGDAYTGIIGEGIADCSLVNNEATETIPSPKLFPNPAVKTVNLSYFWHIATSNSFMRLTDVMGKTIMEQKQENSYGANELSLDVSRLSAGIYYLQIIQEGNIIINERFAKVNP